MTQGRCLDAGALIAIERGDKQLLRHLRQVLAADAVVDVPAGVLAQVGRGGRHQARLARFLGSTGIGFPPLDDRIARVVGEVCARTGVTDVVDVHVAVHARAHRQAIVTTAPDDFTAISPDLDLIVL